MPWHWIGDPTPIGWAITLAYFVGAGTAWAAFRGERALASGQHRQLEQRFWFWIAIGLLALGANKQLDLQILLSALGRSAFEQAHFSHMRRIFQAAFALCLAGAGVFFAMNLVRHCWSLARRYQVATLGVLCLGLFVITRAATFQHVGRILGPVADPVWRDTLELGGIGLIVLASVTAIAGSRRFRGPPC